jgi:hypothetical protein
MSVININRPLLQVSISESILSVLMRASALTFIKGIAFLTTLQPYPPPRSKGALKTVQ